LLFSFSFSQINYPITNQLLRINVTLGSVLFLPTFQVSLKAPSSSFVATSNVPLVACFQEQYAATLNGNAFVNDMVISNNSANWKTGSCTYFFKIPANSNTSINIDFGLVPISFGLYPENATGLGIVDVTLSLGAVGDSCLWNSTLMEVFNGANCVASATIPTIVFVNKNGTLSTDNITVNNNATGLYFFQLPFIPYRTGKIVFSACSVNSNSTTFSIRRDGNPFSSSVMTDCSAPAVIENPREGLFGYYVFVNNQLDAPQSFSITLTPTQFTSNVSAFIEKLVLPANAIYYIQVDLNKNTTNGNELWFNLGTHNTSGVMPNVFASLEQYPQPGNADILSCNAEYCNKVNTIKFNSTRAQTWFIGIQNTIGNETWIGVWFNSLCAPGCAAHGYCEMNGPLQGQCQCIEGFIGVNCNTQNGIGPQFIVLIIIAFLVALTAVIGFGAWAYMRRKKNQYDIVS